MNLTAIPSGLLNSYNTEYSDHSKNSKRNAKGRNNNTNSKTNKKQMVSKTYYTLGPRPRFMKSVNPDNIITVNMAYDQDSFLTTTTTVTTVTSLAVVLNSFAGVSAYLALFDQYRIDLLEVWLEPRFSVSTVSANTGVLVTAIDLDDATAPASYTEVAEHQSSISSSG